MFEKEAEERAKRLEEKQTLGVYDNDEDLARDEGFNDGEVSGYEEGFQNGAEFGYNKAKEEMQEQGLALQSDMDKTIEQNIQLKNQIEKMKMCCNCEKWRNWKEELDDISYSCSKHNATDKCKLWKLKEN